MKTVDRSPWLFRLAKQLIRRELPGGRRLLGTCQQLGLFDVQVRHPLAEGIAIDVPIYREATAWDRADVLGYESAHMGRLAAVASRLEGPVLLLDCGADIGTFSVLMAMRCPAIERIVAFEPNRVACDVLRTNLGRLPIPAETRCAAVSDFVGWGDLVAPLRDPSEHSYFLMEAPNGDVPVTRIDELPIRWEDYSVVLALDVEGSELAVLRGAADALSRARSFAVSIHASRSVARRTRRDPSQCIRFLHARRACNVTVSELPDMKLRVTSDLFEQLDGAAYDVVCESTGEPSVGEVATEAGRRRAA